VSALCHKEGEKKNRSKKKKRPRLPTKTQKGDHSLGGGEILVRGKNLSPVEGFDTDNGELKEGKGKGGDQDREVVRLNANLSNRRTDMNSLNLTEKSRKAHLPLVKTEKHGARCGKVFMKGKKKGGFKHKRLQGNFSKAKKNFIRKGASPEGSQTEQSAVKSFLIRRKGKTCKSTGKKWERGEK